MRAVVCARVDVHVCAVVCACMRSCACLQLCARVFMCMCVHACVCVQLCVRVCACTCPLGFWYCKLRERLLSAEWMLSKHDDDTDGTLTAPHRAGFRITLSDGTFAKPLDGVSCLFYH